MSKVVSAHCGVGECMITLFGIVNFGLRKRALELHRGVGERCRDLQRGLNKERARS
jgi:hypothetical protein